MKLLLTLLLWPWQLLPAVTADCIIHWEGITQGTFNHATAPTGTDGTYDSWGSGTRSRFTIAANTLGLSWPNPIVVGATTYTTLGSNVLLNDADNGGADQFIDFYFPGGAEAPSVNEIAVAGFLTCNVSNDTGSVVNLDLMLLSPPSGAAWSVTQLVLDENDGPIHLRSHSELGGSHAGSEITLTKNKTYFVVHFRDMSATQVVVTVYDPAAGFALVGTSTSACADQNTFSMRLESGYIGDPTGDITWGDIAFLYEPSAQDLIDLTIPASGTINATTINATTLVAP